MNKVLLLTVAILLILMTMTSPAQIRHMIDTGAPLAIVIWLSPIFLITGIYYLIKHPVSNDLNNTGELVGMKGGKAESAHPDKKGN